MSNSEGSPQHPRCEKCSDLILELETADKRGCRKHGDAVYDVLLRVSFGCERCWPESGAQKPISPRSANATGEA
jgi:hypothetical protein